MLTTGTGSGKSLTYILPIVDHVLRRGGGRVIQAIIVYPMNALANSQMGELEKFLCRGYPNGRAPVTFKRYTGQESEEERNRIIAKPPDIPLTNYVMLELALTRPWDYRLIKAARGLACRCMRGVWSGRTTHRAKGYRSGRGRKAVWEDLEFLGSTKSIQPQWYIPVESIPEKTRERCRHYRVGFCDVASATNERTLVATLIPRDAICGHKVPTIVFRDASPWVYALWLAVANSFAMDFLVRMKVSLTMTYTTACPFPVRHLKMIPVPFLVPRVLRLVCTANEMTDLWNRAAADGYVFSTIGTMVPFLE